MPTYVYRCAKCGEDLEVYQTFSEEPLKRHTADGGKLTKVLSPVGIVLKGSGFYKNDSGSGARGRKREESSNGDSSSSSEANGSGAKASDSKASDSGSGDASKQAATSEKKTGDKKNGDQKNGAKKSPVKSA